MATGHSRYSQPAGTPGEAQTDNLLIGFDSGTSAIKAILVDTSGRVLSKSSRKVELIRPFEDRCEIDPARYVENIIEIITELAKDAGTQKDTIRAICSCAASGNTVLLDGNRRPLGNTISWLDKRTSGREAELWPELDPEEIYRSTGWPWRGVFPLAHLAWLRDNKPQLWSKARYFAMNDTFVYHELCGNLATDPSKASTSFLYNQPTGSWNRDLLDILGITESSLPEIVPSGTVVGTLSPAVAKRTGLQEHAQIVTGSFDHPSAARSTGVLEQGELLISAGTSWVAFAPLESRETALSIGALADPFLTDADPAGPWGAMLSLTAVAEKIDTLLAGLFGSSADLYRMFDSAAENAPPGAGGMLINPWEQDPGEILSIFSAHSTNEAARGLMEGCAFLMKNRIEKIAHAAGIPFTRIILVGGPTKSPIWPEILATILDRTISIPDSGQHAGALGAAILAGVGSGIFPDIREGYTRMKSLHRDVEPVRHQVDMYRNMYQRFSDEFGLSA